MKKEIIDEMFRFIGLTTKGGDLGSGTAPTEDLYRNQSDGKSALIETESPLPIYHERDTYLPATNPAIFSNPFSFHLGSTSMPSSKSPPSLPPLYTSTPPPTLQTVPPPHPTFTLTYPTPQILLVTISRPSQMNSLPLSAHWEGDSIFQWYDSEPSLRVAIITGEGWKAFCAGQDLVSLRGGSEDGEGGNEMERGMPESGFAGLSRRKGKKPVLAAVNGVAFGGGFEIVLNCDITIASPHSKFALPEPTLGLYAAAGGLPRLTAIVGLPLASEIALTSRILTAPEALSYNLVNRISATPSSLVEETVAIARDILKQSPDSIIATRAGLREVREGETEEVFLGRILGGENFGRGVAAFLGGKAGRGKVVWVDSKL